MNLISEKKVKVRKAHNCWGCTKLFPIKSDMQVVKYSEEGHVYSVYWCKFCQSVLTKRFEHDDTFAYSELKDTQEYLEELNI